MPAKNSTVDALADVAPVDIEAFKTHRTGTGRKAVELDKGLLARVRDIVMAHGGLMGTKFFTSTQAETDAYNDMRETAAKKAEREIPPRITVEANAARLARKDAARFTRYVEEIGASLTDKAGDPAPKAVSLRVRNDGTEDNPQCRWALVLVNHRERAPKEKATA